MTEAPLRMSCDQCQQGISCVDGTYRFHRCRGYVKLDEGYFHNHFPDEDVSALKIMSEGKWVRCTRAGKFRATDMKAGVAKVHNASYVELLSFHVVKGRMCDKRRKRVMQDPAALPDVVHPAADPLFQPVAPAAPPDEDIDNVQDQTNDFIDNQDVADNDFVEYDNDAFMPIETLTPPAPTETSSLRSLPFERRTTILLTVFLLLSVIFGVAYNLMYFEAPVVEQMEEIKVPDVVEEPAVVVDKPVDKPEIELQAIAIEEVPGEHENGLFTAFAVMEAFVLLACMPKLCLGH